MHLAASPRPEIAGAASEVVGRIRRSPIGLASLGIVCGLGLTVAGVTLVRAADDAGIFEMMWFDALNRVARSVRVERSYPQPRYASEDVRPTRRLHRPKVTARAAPRPVKKDARVQFAAANERVWSRRTMCVRSCDGYTFPVGTLGATRDLPAHEAACAAACPGAETALYTLAPGQAMTEMAGARSVKDGSVYGRLKTAFLFQHDRVAACSCQGPDNIAKALPILLDPTLREGDLFVDRKGDARVFAGPASIPHPSRAFADYRATRTLGPTARSQVDRLMGTSQREATAKAFERRMRTVQAQMRPASLREVAAPAGSASGVRVFQVSSGGESQASGARIILIR